MKKERLHPEITCPHCRTGFGGHKSWKEKDGSQKMVHLDIMWCYESGLQQDCQQENIYDNVDNIDGNGNPEFTEDFQKKLKELREKFETNPDDIDKGTCEFGDYHISFVECMNWGELDEEDEDYDRESMSGEKLKEMYDNGVNLKDALRSFIIKVENN